MATSTPTPAQTELINSLSQDEIPIKLRCAICSRLAVDAFRLPCCEQAICSTCQSTLPSSCPVCEHTPVAAEDCKPNKSLRTTIKVFLRTEQRKREALPLREEKNTPPATPVVAEPTPAEAPAPIEDVVIEPAKDTLAGADVNGNEVPSADQSDEAPPNPPEAEDSEAQKDVPQQSIEETATGQETITDGDANKEDETTEEKEGGDAEKDANGQLTNGQAPGFGAGFGFDPSAAGGFPGMGFGGDMTPQMQIQMMMAMQNGMAPGGFGNFPMMGMPGMGMDPMAMQSMFMNGGFGAGMNGMNMGMGMGGFDGGVGAGFNNGWNGQQSWNVGPDNFNHPNAASMGHGDYGNNSGYASHASGYNQGNYGRPNQYNDYQNNYGSRGRGRGRGGHGRGGYGGYGNGSNDQFSQQQQYGAGQQANGLMSDSGSVPKGPKVDAANPGDVDEFGREIRPKSPVAEDENAVQKPETATTEGDQGTEVKADEASKNELETTQDENITKPIQTLDEIENAAWQQPAAYDPNSYLGQGGYGRGHPGSFSSMQPPIVKLIDVPINAPTGPKAMREGLPNTSIYNMRGRGYSAVGRASSRPSVSESASVAPDASLKEGKEQNRSRSATRDRSKDRSRSQNRDKDRDRDRDRDQDKDKNRKRSRSRDHHRRHRHRSTSRSEDDKETERRRERRRERQRQREDEVAVIDAVIDDGPGDTIEAEKAPTTTVPDTPTEVETSKRSRSASPSESKRSSHRSRRDRDKYRDRSRDRNSSREHRPSSSYKHHSHRSHRDDKDRSRSRDRDRDREREREREREHKRSRHSRHISEDVADAKTEKSGGGDREKEKEKEKEKVKEKEKEKETPLQTPVEPEPSTSRRRSTISNGVVGTSIEIKGASTRRQPKNPFDEIAAIIPTGPRVDRTKEKERGRDRPSSSRHEHRSSRHESSRDTRDRDRDRARDRGDRDKDKGGEKRDPPKPTPKDPHEIEREARNRERLLKEAQRIAGLAGRGVKRRAGDDNSGGVGGSASGVGGRKRGRKSGNGGEEEREESRIARLEREREGGRWA